MGKERLRQYREAKAKREQRVQTLFAPHPVRYGEWSDEEDEVIRSSYFRIPAREIGKRIGRTHNQVIGRANALRHRGLL